MYLPTCKYVLSLFDYLGNSREPIRSIGNTIYEINEN